MRRALIAILFCLAPLASAAEGFDARLNAAVAQAERGEHDAALAGFEALARDFPARPEPLNNLAAEQARRGDLVRARETLERALRTHPSYATAHDNLRSVYAALASDAYRKALPVGTEPVAAPELALITASGHPQGGTAAAPATGAAASIETAPTPRPLPISVPSVTQAPPVTVDPATARMNGLAFGAFAAVDAWAEAWASKDVAGYLAAYDAGFVPPDGLTRAAWEAQRTERIRAPKQISVRLAQRDLVIDAGGERATMRFVQTYRSDRFNGSAWKTLELARSGSRWLIVGERAGR
jgi:tetratricopeptide (TPR) repeat protein